MAKLKILLVSETHEGGGAEAVFRDTLKIAKILGFECRTFVSTGKINLFSYVFSIKYFLKMYQEIKFFKPDIIHLHNYYHFLTPSILLAIKLLKKKYNCKVVFTAHDYHLICPNSGLQVFDKGYRQNIPFDQKSISYKHRFDHRSYLHSLLKILQHGLAYKILHLRSAIDVIISPSEFLKCVFENFEIKQNIHVIRNPIEIIKSNISTLNKDTTLISIVFMGRISVEKGILNFIKKLNDETETKIDFHLYGEGEDLKDIKNLALRKHLNLFYHGFLPRNQLINKISEYDLFVLPSIWYENAPLSIIEAAQAGLPVLVPSYGGLKEMAQFTKFHFEFSYTDCNLDTLLKTAYKHAGANELILPSEFTHETYKGKIEKLYGDLFI